MKKKLYFSMVLFSLLSVLVMLCGAGFAEEKNKEESKDRHTLLINALLRPPSAPIEANFSGLKSMLSTSLSGDEESTPVNFVIQSDVTKEGLASSDAIFRNFEDRRNAEGFGEGKEKKGTPMFNLKFDF
ncbi:MAG: hypothetical protein HQK89_11220 [Nitrospirae bacterium]|nr:hypothetical protein [Nitrospirota bacterium]